MKNTKLFAFALCAAMVVSALAFSPNAKAGDTPNTTLVNLDPSASTGNMADCCWAPGGRVALMVGSPHDAFAYDPWDNAAPLKNMDSANFATGKLNAVEWDPMNSRFIMALPWKRPGRTMRETLPAMILPLGMTRRSFRLTAVVTVAVKESPSLFCLVLR